MSASVAAAALAACAGACSRPGPSPLPEPPRAIVLVVVDALGAGHLPCYGYERETAPFLTRLAAEGTVFARAYAASTWTAPSMASVFTGVYPVQHEVFSGLNARMRQERFGLPSEVSRLPEELETLPEALKRAGYATRGVADNFNVGPTLGFARGFDRLVSHRRAQGAAGVDAQALEWMPELTAGGRYFLYLHYLDAHFPYASPGPHFPAPDDDLRARKVAAYDSAIRYVDGRLEEVYRRFGWADDAMVVVTADHGEEFWQHGGVGHGRSLYEETLRVPLIVRLPGGAGGGGRVRVPVSLVDLLPTLREAAGLPADERNEGRSWMPLLAGDRREADGKPWTERTLFAHLRARRPAGDRESRAVVRGDRKLIVGPGPAERHLFDLGTDPGERTDLAAARPDEARELAGRLERFERDARRYRSQTVTVPEDEEVHDNLRALGYVQ